MKLLTCDDHALFRAGLRTAVHELDPDGEMAEVGTASELFRMLEERSDFDLLLLDLGLPDVAGLELLERVRNPHPATPVVIVSASDDRSVIRRALGLGAMGFIPKTASGPVLVGALRLVVSGGVYVPPELLEELQQEIPANVPSPTLEKNLESLTARQREVVMLIAKGLTNREIAGVLDISEATVKHHAAAIYATLEVTNRTEAASVLHSLLVADDT